jgi:GntR family transcriptional regulator/MocR family aminotransferase
MVTYALDAQSALPLYEQLYRAIRADIRSGALSPDARMPSRRKLAGHLHVSAVTVDTAYEQLTAEGYIYALPRRGYFVSRVQSIQLFPPTAETRAASCAPEEAVGARPAYDLRTHSVDTAHFPFSVWARLMREVISERNTDLLQATHSQGVLSLREQICAYLHDFRGVRAQPEQIVVGAGSEYLTGLLLQLLGRERIYAVEEPGYYKLRSIYENNGARIAHVALDEQGLSPDALRESGAQAAHVTPSHQFPMGMAMPVSRRMTLLRWAEEDEARVLIEDDYDSEFRFTGRPVPAMQSLDAHGQVIYLNTFARSLAPSLRVSYMVLPERYLKRYREKMRYYACTVPAFEQYALSKLMAGGHLERHIARMRAVYKARRDALEAAVRALDLGECLLDGAGLHVLLRARDGRDAGELARLALENGVAITPLHTYFATQPPQWAEHLLVLGFAGLDEERLYAAAERLREAWQA